MAGYMTPEMLKMSALSNIGAKKQNVALQDDAKKAQENAMMQTALMAAFTLASGGAGIPGLLSKIPGVGQAMTATNVAGATGGAGGALPGLGGSMVGAQTLKYPAFAKAMKFLSPAAKTTAGGTAASEALNRMIIRGLTDVMLKDPSKSGDPQFASGQKKSKWEGYLSDVLFGGQRLAGYQTPNAQGALPVNPYSGDPFEQIDWKNIFKNI